MATTKSAKKHPKSIGVVKRGGRFVANASRASTGRRQKARSMELTASYLPAKEGGYTVEVLEARGVYSQGDTFEEARTNLHEVVALMLEEAPHQFGARKGKPPPGALTEKLFVLLPK
jgi:predicted RNase H-like HicB family nuclease